MKRAITVAIIALSCACSRAPEDGLAETSSSDLAVFAGGESLPQADARFRSDPRWLGGDAAYSVDLGGKRTLWLFGDTFVATTPKNARSESKMVRNTVGISRGDLADGAIELAWRNGAGGVPASFFEEQGTSWHWPQHGARLGTGGPLVLFFSVLRETPGEGLGFAQAGWRIARIDDADAPVSSWKHVWLDPPAPRFDAVVGSAVVRRDGFLVTVAYRSQGAHVGYLARFQESALLAGQVAAEWWAGPARGWVAEDALGGLPEAIMDEAGSECSVHYDAKTQQWLHVASRGFGATTIAIRTAPALEGPWSAPTDVFTPPEGGGKDVIVYAAKAHPQFVSSDGSLLVTYAANSLDFPSLLTQAGASLYWPRVVRLRR
ncbi:MAG TPA: DUF4185 domain-containing protein [Labilithrix sp.]|nr:DUF4185 domain-containing protein [Labilithrix sp.]